MQGRYYLCFTVFEANNEEQISFLFKPSKSILHNFFLSLFPIQRHILQFNVLAILIEEQVPHSQSSLKEISKFLQNVRPY